MKAMTMATGTLVTLLLCGWCQEPRAQQVYRCKSSDGSTTFSDLPCRSDIGQHDRVDATPHQGHRSSPAPGRPAWTAKDAPAGSAAGSAGRGASGAASEAGKASLSRRERLSLERERGELLSGLKRRHVKPADRRAMIRDLRRIDRKLGILPADVADMPFHNREVYEEHRIYPGI